MNPCTDCPENTPTPKVNKALFLDLDHTIVRPLEGRTFPKDADDWQFLPGMPQAVFPFIEAGFCIIIISNQGGIEAGHHTEEEVETKLQAVLNNVLTLYALQADDFSPADVPDLYSRAGFFYCPTNDKANPDRKPNPGMIHRAAEKHGIDLENSFFVGDMDSDQQAAQAAGVGKYFHVDRFLQLQHFSPNAKR